MQNIHCSCEKKKNRGSAINQLILPFFLPTNLTKLSVQRKKKKIKKKTKSGNEKGKKKGKL